MKAATGSLGPDPRTGLRYFVQPEDAEAAGYYQDEAVGTNLYGLPEGVSLDDVEIMPVPDDGIYITDSEEIVVTAQRRSQARDIGWWRGINFLPTQRGSATTTESVYYTPQPSYWMQNVQALGSQASAHNGPWTALNHAALSSLPGGQSVSLTDDGDSGSTWESPYAHGAQGLTAWGAQNLTRAEDVRLVYDRVRAGLDPEDSAGRSALKEATRRRTPAPQRALIQSVRPSTAARPGSIGGAARGNARWTTAARIGGHVGRGLGVVSIGLGAVEIATAEDHARAAAGVAGGTAGGIAGGIVGAEIGAGIGVWFGGVGAVPGAVIGGVVGGFVGSIGLGIMGHDVGTGIYDDVTGRRR